MDSTGPTPQVDGPSLVDMISLQLDSDESSVQKQTVCGMAAGQGFLSLVTGSQLMVFPLRSDEQEQLEPTCLDLPFQPATLCVNDQLIFCASTESLFLLEVSFDDPPEFSEEAERGQACKVEVLRATSGNETLFPLIHGSTFSPSGEWIGLTTAEGAVILIATQTLAKLVISPLAFSANAGTARADNVDVIAFGASLMTCITQQNVLFLFRLESQTGRLRESPTLDDSLPEVALLKNGGQVCASKSVTCALLDDRNALLWLGFSDCTLTAYSTQQNSKVEMLSPLRNIALASESALAKVQTNLGTSSSLQLLHGTAVFSSWIILVANGAIFALNRQNYAFSFLGALSEVASIAGVGLSDTGCVVTCFSPFTRRIHAYFVAPPPQALSSLTNESRESLVHAAEVWKPPMPPPIEAELAAVAKKPVPKGSGGLFSRPQLNTTKPVTFGRPIRSSGYASPAAAPWSVQQAAKKREKEKLAGKIGRKKTAPPTSVTARYDLSVGPPVTELTRSSAILQSRAVGTGAITFIEFDSIGNLMLTGSNDSTAHALKLPCVKYGGDGYPLKGHQSQILCGDISLSLQNPLMLLGSFDGRFSAWCPSKGREESYLMEQPVPGREVKQARFFYMDQVMVVAAGPSIHAYTYRLDDGGGDLDRKRNNSCVKKVLTMQTEAQSVNDFDCYNSFLSNLLIWGGSNKTVGAYDVVSQQQVRLYTDAHARPIHSVSILRSSRYADPTPEGLHTFITAATDQSVRLWDLRDRSPNAVRVLSAHVNASMKVGIALSPCGRFIAVGSENRACYLYDKGTGAVVEKSAMPDSVGAVRFHPTQPILAVGANNGQVKFFGDRVEKKEI
jgi:WD40 repeat protein